MCDYILNINLRYVLQYLFTDHKLAGITYLTEKFLGPFPLLTNSRGPHNCIWLMSSHRLMLRIIFTNIRCTVAKLINLAHDLLTVFSCLRFKVGCTSLVDLKTEFFIQSICNWLLFGLFLFGFLVFLGFESFFLTFIADLREVLFYLFKCLNETLFCKYCERSRERNELSIK